MFIKEGKLTGLGWVLVLATVVFFGALAYVNSQDYTPAVPTPVTATVITNPEVPASTVTTEEDVTPALTQEEL